MLYHRMWRDVISYLGSGAADEGPHRQQVSRQTDDEDEDVEDGEGSHLVVDDALLPFLNSCGAGVSGKRRRGRKHHRLRLKNNRRDTDAFLKCQMRDKSVLMVTCLLWSLSRQQVLWLRFGYLVSGTVWFKVCFETERAKACGKETTLEMSWKKKKKLFLSQFLTLQFNARFSAKVWGVFVSFFPGWSGLKWKNVMSCICIHQREFSNSEIQIWWQLLVTVNQIWSLVAEFMNF